MRMGIYTTENMNPTHPMVLGVWRPYGVAVHGLRGFTRGGHTPLLGVWSTGINCLVSTERFWINESSRWGITRMLTIKYQYFHQRTMT